MPIQRTTGTGVRPVSQQVRNRDVTQVKFLSDPHRRRQGYARRIAGLDVSVNSLDLGSTDVQDAIEEVNDKTLGNQGQIDGIQDEIDEINEKIIVKTVGIADFLLQSGATTGTLHNGEILTVNLPSVSSAPKFRFKVDLNTISSSKDLLIDVICAHSTTGQTLDLDLDYICVNPGDNFDNKVAGATLTEAPVTPATAYERFVETFTIPIEDIQENGSLECKFTRDVGADTGDLHVWVVRVYQEA